MFESEQALVFVVLLLISILAFQSERWKSNIFQFESDFPEKLINSSTERQNYSSNSPVISIKIPTVILKTPSIVSKKKSNNPLPENTCKNTTDVISFKPRPDRNGHSLPNVTYNFSYNPVIYKIKHKGVLIIAFTDINFWLPTQIWIQRMKILGYADILVFALDIMVYEKMKNSELITYPGA